MERHAQTIMVGLVTVGIIFVSSSILGQNADIRVLQAQVKELRDFVVRNERSFITQSEFNIHQRENDRRFKALEKHINLRGEHP